MIDRVEERFDLKPARLIGDTAYGTAPMLGWMVEDKRIEPHVPVWDRTQRKDGTLSSSDFHWDEQADQYRCPQGMRCASNGARSRTRDPHHQGRHDHLSRQPSRLREMPDEGALLPEHTDRKITRSVHESQAMSRARSPTPKLTSNHAMIARRSRCCSPTSNAS